MISPLLTVTLAAGLTAAQEECPYGYFLCPQGGCCDSITQQCCTVAGKQSCCASDRKLETEDRYQACGHRCAADPTCQSWDVAGPSGKCQLSPDPYELPELATAKPPTPVDPALEKLIEKYQTMQNATCAKALAKVPALDEGDSQAFMTAYQAFKGGGGADGDAAVIAAAKKLLTPAVDKFLSLPDSIKGGLDADLVLCAVLSDAASGIGGSPKSSWDPHAMAKFAVQGPTYSAVVDSLLADPLTMKDLLVAGGAFAGRYGDAAGILANITKAFGPLPPASSEPFWDDRDPSSILRRLAIGMAASLAEPQGLRYHKEDADPNVDPVARYGHYADAYKAGDLDPAFPIFTSFEIAHIMDSDAPHEDELWFRKTFFNYRPDEVVMGYGSRYLESVHSEVAYGDSSCPHFPEGVCSGHYSDIPVGGDVCGGRAFWGRFTRKAFGIPSWGATETGHASMATWTPAGWERVLGSAWPFCWWGPRGGSDYQLETLARENRTEYQKVLRGEWVARARGEDRVDTRWTDVATSSANGQGGLWSALMLYKKKIVAAESEKPNRTLPDPDPEHNKVDALVAKWKQPKPSPPPGPKTLPDGTIVIPADSYSSKAKSASAEVMWSADDGTQVLHNGCASPVGPPCFNPSSSAWTYTVTVPKAGDYYLTSNITTYHYNQDLYVSVNGGKNTSMNIFYTVGWWNETQPVEVSLNSGANTLMFSRTSDRELVFKNFNLYVKEPVIPPPPGNFTPQPAPSPGGSYIEVPATTSCQGQGIADVPEDLCSHACLALGFKSTGDRARPNISGCFVLTTGEYAGNCNYNTNASATCERPCELYGTPVRSLCIRK